MYTCNMTVVSMSEEGHPGCKPVPTFREAGGGSVLFHEEVVNKSQRKSLLWATFMRLIKQTKPLEYSVTFTV